MAKKSPLSPEKSRSNLWIILPLSFLSGAGVMILEICASRLLSPYFGNSIYVWGSLIGVVLLALSLGYILGGYFADRFPSEKIIPAIVALSGLLVFLVPVFSGAVFSFARGFGFVFGPLFSASVLLTPASVLLGAVSPYSMKLLGKGNGKGNGLGKSSGKLYAVSTAGSLVGTFLATFVLAPFIGTRETVLGLGILLLFSGLASLFFFSQRGSFALLLLPMAALLVPFLGAVPSFGGADFVPSGAQIIHSEDSLYQRIIIADRPFWGNSSEVARLLLIDGQLAGVVYRDRPWESPFPLVDYFSLAYTIKPDIASALFVGGGAFSLPRRFLQGNPSIGIDVVEIDPAVVRVSREYLNLSDDPGFGISVGDGRVFLNSAEGKYDLVGINAYSGGTIPAHMLTVEFFELVSSRLADDGVLAINLIGATEGRLAKVTEIAHNTLSEVFPAVYTIPVGGALPENRVANILIFASKNPSIIPSETLKKRAVSLSASLGIAEFPEYLNGYDPYWPRNSSEGGIFTDNYSPVNNLIDPELSSFFLLG